MLKFGLLLPSAFSFLKGKGYFKIWPKTLLHHVVCVVVVQSECDDWVRTAKMMVCELTGEEYTEAPPSNLTVDPVPAHRTETEASLDEAPKDAVETEVRVTEEWTLLASFSSGH